MIINLTYADNLMVRPFIIFVADALNTQRSESTKTTAFEIVFGQKPNRLCEISDKTGPLLEEDLSEIFKDQDFSRVTVVESLTELKENCNGSHPSTPKSSLQESKSTLHTIDAEALDDILQISTTNKAKEVAGSFLGDAYDHTISKNDDGHEVLADSDITADMWHEWNPVKDDEHCYSSGEDPSGKPPKVTEAGGNAFEELLAELRDVSGTKVKEKVTILDSDLLSYVKKSISSERIAGVMTGKESIPSYAYKGKVPEKGQAGYDEFIHYLQINEIYEDKLSVIRDHILKYCKKENGLFLDGEKILSFASIELLAYIEYMKAVPANKGGNDIPVVENSSSNTEAAIFPVTSPRRKRIRDKVVQQGLVNADKMTKKYAKQKHIIIEEFQVGENVSGKIPKQDRISSDNKRLACVVVDKRGGRTPSYRLACSSGTLDRRVTTFDTMHYPGRVEINKNNLNKSVSLRQAAREASVVKASALSCKCKKGCTGKTCVCRKDGKVCSSRCHKGISCKNNQFHQLVKEQMQDAKEQGGEVDNSLFHQLAKEQMEDSKEQGGEVENSLFHQLAKEQMEDSKEQRREVENLLFPSYGGHIFGSDGSKIILRNTCRFDSWFAILRVLWENNHEKMKSVCESYKDGSPNSVNILHLIELEQYLQAKAGAALIINLEIINHSIYFYGNENEGFMKIFGFLLKHVISSACNSKYCPNPNHKASLCSFPTITTDEKVTKKMFSQSVHEWLFNRQQSVCGRKLCKAPPGDDLVFWDVQLQERSARSDLVSVRVPYCGGVRIAEPREFQNGLLTILPVGIDVASRNKQLIWPDIPDSIELLKGGSLRADSADFFSFQRGSPPVHPL
eukprot:Seg314.4 transcript_id=Seg314.4/GoldUCD/mRNA.D3Y31 product="hypothetical protein" protein_id=Seg314.4/GoldUCD/D3Y31